MSACPSSWVLSLHHQPIANMSFPHSTHPAKQWVHLIWASVEGRPWVPNGKEACLTQRMQQACCRRGLHLDLAAAHHEHLHLLVRVAAPKDLDRLRTLSTQVCRRFMQEYLLRPLRREITFEDWSQPLSYRKLGELRRHLLQQAEVHQQMTLEQELHFLHIKAADQRCVILGDVMGRSGSS